MLELGNTARKIVPLSAMLADFVSAVDCVRRDPSLEHAASCCVMSRRLLSAYVMNYTLYSEVSVWGVHDEFKVKLDEAAVYMEKAKQQESSEDRRNEIACYIAYVKCRSFWLDLIEQKGLDAFEESQQVFALVLGEYGDTDREHYRLPDLYERYTEREPNFAFVRAVKKG